MGSTKTVIVLDEDSELRELVVRLLREARPGIATVLISSTLNDSVAGGIDELLRERPRPIVLPTCTRPSSPCVIYNGLPCGHYLGCLRKPDDFTIAELASRVDAALEARSQGGM